MGSPSNFVATCSSVTLQVESGSIAATTTVAGKVVTVIVEDGGGVSFNLEAGTLENIGDEEIEVTINGGEPQTLEPGAPPLPLVPCADIVVDNCAICRNHIMDLCTSRDLLSPTAPVSPVSPTHRSELVALFLRSRSPRRH